MPEPDNSAHFEPRATELEIATLNGFMKNPLPSAWAAVLQVANGFETCYPVSTPPFFTMNVDQLFDFVTDVDDAKKRFPSSLKNSLTIAIDLDGGFYALDLSTENEEGDCNVVQINYGSNGEGIRYKSISEFLEANLCESDFGYFQKVIPSPKTVIHPDLALLEASMHGYLKKAKMLVEGGANIHAVDQHGQTVLMNAVSSPFLVRYLLDCGADVNAQTPNGDTALLNAAIVGNIKVIRMLLEHGADVNAVSWQGTALVQSIEGNRSEHAIPKLLLSHGADPNIANNLGRTPLIIAVQDDDAKLVSLLLAKGADANRKDNQGMTAITWARQQNRQEIIKILLESGAVE